MLKKKYQGPRNKRSSKIRLYPNSTMLRNGLTLYERYNLPFIAKTVTKGGVITISLPIMTGISCKTFVVNNNPKAQLYRKVSSSTNTPYINSPWQTWSKIN